MENLEKLFNEGIPIEKRESLEDLFNRGVPVDEEYPLIQEAKKMQQTISQKLGEDWRVGAAKETAKEIGRDISAGPWAKIWEQAGTEDANSLRSVLQTAVGLTSGMAGFLAGTVATVANEIKQVVTQGLEAAKGKGFSMNWEEQRAWQKAAESFFEYDVTDPIAQTVLMAIGAIPSGIKSFFDVLSGISQTDKGKEVVAGIADNLPDIPFIELKKKDIQAAISASLDAAGVIGELAAFGAVFKTIIPAKAPKPVRPQPDLKKPIPKKPRPPYPEGGIERLFAKERLLKKPEEILAAIERHKAGKYVETKRAERERIKALGKKEPVFTKPDPTTFNKAIDKIAEHKQPYLTRYTEKELSGFKIRTSIDGKTGFAIKPDGDLVNVFNTGKKGRGAESVTEAISMGVKKLDCFDGPLVDYYTDFGFKITEQIPWNEKYRPKGWKDEWGKPDVVYMNYKGGTRDASVIRANREAARRGEVAWIGRGEAMGVKEFPPIAEAARRGLVPRKPKAPIERLGKGAEIGHITKEFPEHSLKYDGMYENGVHSFTPQKGPLKGRTFSLKEPTAEKIRAEIKDVESRFNVPDLTPEQVKAVLDGKDPATTLESLGFQASYEKTAKYFQSVAQDRTIKTREFRARMRNEALQEVPGNALDRMAIRYIKEGKYETYVNNMPEIGQIKPGELLRVDPTSHKLFATLKVGGKEKAAVRQSGFHAILEFQNEIKGYKDIGKHTYEWADPTRWMQEIDQGKFGGPAQKHILWPTRKTVLARGEWGNRHKTTLTDIAEKYRINSKKRDSSLGDVVEHIESGDIGKAPAEILKNPKVAGFLKDYKEPVKLDIIRAGQEIRRFADQLLEEQNLARRKRGQREIDRREFYRPWVIKTNIWSRLGLQRSKPAEVMDVPALPEFIRPNQRFNPRAEARMGLLGKYPKETRMLRLMADYIDTAAKDIFDTNIIHHNKIHAAVLREKQPFAANAVDRWTAEAFAGTGHWLSRGVKRVFPPWMRKPVHMFRRNLTRAVFPLNWSWNMFIQTCSAGLTYIRYGNKSSLYGLKYFTDRKLNRAIKTNAYTHIIKSRWGGRIAYQDVQTSLMKNKKLQTTKIERAESFLNVLTNEIESGLTGHAIAAAYRDGKVRLGLEGRALWEYASEGGAKTQSMYNYGDLPGLLRAKEVGAVFPFQTYAFEVFNTIRELNVIGVRRVVGKTGIYETMSARSALGKATISRRLRMLARWTAAIMITNAVAEAAIGRKPWRSVSSFVPFLSYILKGDSPRGPAPIQYKDDFMRGVKNLIEYGDWRQLRRWAIRYHVPAGVQLERTIQGIEAIAGGGVVRDVRGKPILEIPREEYTAALLKGPWKTPTAIKKMREKKKKTLRTIKVLD